MTEIILSILGAVGALFVVCLFRRFRCLCYLRQLRKIKISISDSSTKHSGLYAHWGGTLTGLSRRLEVYDQQCIPDVRRFILNVRNHQHQLEKGH